MHHYYPTNSRELPKENYTSTMAKVTTTIPAPIFIESLRYPEIRWSQGILEQKENQQPHI